MTGPTRPRAGAAALVSRKELDRAQARLLQHVFRVPGVAANAVSRAEDEAMVIPKDLLELVRNRDCRFL